MKLTKQLEKEVRQVYEAYWDSLLNVNLKAFSSFLDDNFKQIGTTEAEVFFNKKDAVKSLKATKDQIVGNIELRNRIIKVDPLDKFILITEESDAYVKIDAEWTFYSKTRISSLLQKKSNGWKFLQQHVSFPDSKTAEGETIALEQIKMENLQLRDAVKRRTAELENKNRELEIEASLEKVRAVAMGMKKPEDLLDVCRVISEQLQQFGVEHIRNVQTAIIDEQIGQYLCYQFFTPYDNTVVENTEYLKSPVEHEMVKQMLASRDGHFIGSITGKDLKEFRTHRKEENHFHDPLLDKASELSYCFLSIGEGGLGLSLYQPIDDGVLTLFKRFHQVFSLAYQRFRDIQKAEEQTREAQIEAALERVRSRAMAMHKSEELTEAGELLYKELSKLGIENLTTGYVLFNDNATIGYSHGVNPMTGSIRHLPVGMPHNETWVMKSIVTSWKKKEPLLVLELDPEETIAHQTFIAERSTNFPISAEQLLSLSPERLKIHVFNFSQGYLLIVGGTVLTEAQQEMVIRFAKVFEQTYTRFLDLQKAEAQARAAQVNLAVERVRARALAMFKSEEILQVVNKLKEEIMGLDIPNVAAATIHLKEPDGTCRVWDLTSLEIEDEGLHLPLDIRFRLEDTHPDFFMRRVWENEADYFVVVQEESDFKHTIQWLRDNDQSEHADEAEEFFRTTQIKKVYHPTVPLNNGRMCIDLLDTPAPEVESILKKMAGAFDLAYKRFEDLQKAEEQTREAQIELSLERIRSQVTAMQESSDLLDIVVTMRTEFVSLGHEAHYFWHMRWLPDRYEKAMTSGDGTRIGMVMTLPRHIHGDIPPVADWEKSDASTHVLAMDVETAVEYVEKMITLGDFEQVDPQAPTLDDIRHIGGLTFVMARTTHGEIGFSLPGTVPDPPTDAVEALARFAGVFDLAYKRFEDLKAAERQHREAQIELALERVRARSMAMHKSDELADLSLELVKQVHALGVATWFCAFNIYDDDPKGSLEWGSNGQGTFPQYRTPREGIFLRYYEAGQRGETLLVNEIGEKECPAHYDYLCSLPGVGEQLLKMKDAGIPFPTSQIDHVAYFKYGYIIFITFEPAHEAHDIFKRFARVFEQTYTRFLDLQRAEAQTREAKIETALEKVRSRTMGMQSSEELPEVANLLFLEVQALGIPAWSCGYNILSEDKTSSTCIMSSEGELQTPFTLPLTEHVSLQPWHQAIVNDEEFFVYAQGGEDLAEHYMYMKSLPELRSVFQQFEDAGISLPTYQVNHLARFTHGFLLFITYEPVPGAHDIFKRFTHVFEQTYTRFLDLKKAETQAREAQIENALEKVRSRSLSMQKPDELIEVAQLLREEMGALGVEELETSSIYIHDESSDTTQCWFTIKNTDDPDRAVTDQMTIDLQDTWVGRKMYAFYRSPAKQASILMQGANRTEWIRYCEEKSDLFSSTDFYGETIPERTYHLYKFSNGYIGAAAPGEISQESWDLLKRATAVFSFAYTRFRDLQNAEASARASLRQASLDRVRADISSMRNSEDLDRITPLMFNELTTLGIPFIRCGVFIVHEKSKTVAVYLSTPEGKSLAAMNLPFDANSLTSRSVDAWKKEEVYVEHWNQADFINWGKSLAEQGHIKDLKTYQGAEAAPQSLHLYFIPFTQGLLYVGSTGTLDAEQIDLVKALSRAFDIAYARYEDFVRLDQAKVEVESAMSELKSTQSQLVQQEKLASLGQLTAGIAHEIKNPLNFVNNFSEVSLELIDEAIEEIQKNKENGHATEMADLLSDIRSNLGKIHEHGTRANGIVTSMLQHSRGGSGEMEPTDLNALIKEYVHLCFHGMRASKNPINVDIQMNLDPPVGMVSLIKEDFARVIINLCNNAFDAMRSKLSDPSQKSGYTPKLTVRTMRNAHHVLIEIADNGPGIPDDIMDKILQPFFTTKKGTEGTGLGLSITHDIVKAHGGNLTVETPLSEKGGRESEGTRFLIQLPVQ